MLRDLSGTLNDLKARAALHCYRYFKTYIEFNSSISIGVGFNQLSSMLSCLSLYGPFEEGALINHRFAFQF